MKQIVQPIPYSSHLRPLNQNTIIEFSLNDKEKELTRGIGNHKFNYIDQNKQLAANFRE